MATELGGAMGPIQIKESVTLVAAFGADGLNHICQAGRECDRPGEDTVGAGATALRSAV